jgi:DNA-binding response OmpR family regulator
VILDLRLPGMSGQECLRRLRASAGTATLPVLLLSAALDEVSTLAPTLHDERTTLLAKPFDLDALLTSMHGLLAAAD